MEVEKTVEGKGRLQGFQGKPKGQKSTGPRHDSLLALPLLLSPMKSPDCSALRVVAPGAVPFFPRVLAAVQGQGSLAAPRPVS